MDTSLEVVRAFYDRYSQPNNAILVLAGGAVLNT